MQGGRRRPRRLFTYRLDDDRYLTVTNASNHDKDLAWFRRHAKDFTGVEMTYGIGQPSQDGGDTEDGSIIFGGASDRGSVMAGASFNNREIVFQRAREWSRGGASAYGNNLLYAGNNTDAGGPGFGYYIIVFVLDMVFGLFASMIAMWFSRHREFRADAGGASLAGRDKMIAALQRLSKTYGETTLPKQVAAFGISGAVGHGLRRLMMSHPPLEERIAALGRMSDSVRTAA